MMRLLICLCAVAAISACEHSESDGSMEDLNEIPEATEGVIS